MMKSLSEAQEAAIRALIHPGVELSSYHKAVVESISPDLQTIVLSQKNVDSPREFRLGEVSSVVVYFPVDENWVIDDDVIVVYDDEDEPSGGVAFYGS